MFSVFSRPPPTLRDLGADLLASRSAKATVGDATTRWNADRKELTSARFAQCEAREPRWLGCYLKMEASLEGGDVDKREKRRQLRDRVIDTAQNRVSNTLQIANARMGNFNGSLLVNAILRKPATGGVTQPRVMRASHIAVLDDWAQAAISLTKPTGGSQTMDRAYNLVVAAATSEPDSSKGVPAHVAEFLKLAAGIMQDGSDATAAYEQARAEYVQAQQPERRSIDRNVRHANTLLVPNQELMTDVDVKQRKGNSVPHEVTVMHLSQTHTQARPPLRNSSTQVIRPASQPKPRPEQHAVSDTSAERPKISARSKERKSTPRHAAAATQEPKQQALSPGQHNLWIHNTSVILARMEPRMARHHATLLALAEVVIGAVDEASEGREAETMQACRVAVAAFRGRGQGDEHKPYLDAIRQSQQPKKQRTVAQSKSNSANVSSPGPVIGAKLAAQKMPTPTS